MAEREGKWGWAGVCVISVARRAFEERWRL
jgi:hypothetical protein